MLTGTQPTTGRDYIVGELIHPSGIQERSVHEEQFHLIYRDNVSGDRLVPADNRDPSPWGNPVYQETINAQAQYPAAYEQLRQIDNGALGGTPKKTELYDLQNDPWETNNLAENPTYAPHVNRMLVALQVWAAQTNDAAIHIFATDPTSVDSNAPVSVSDDFAGGAANLNDRAHWTTRQYGNSGADFGVANGIVDAPPGLLALATYDGVERGSADNFLVSVDTRFTSIGVGGGVVFGYTDLDNFFEFQLLDGRSAPGGTNKDVVLRQRSNGSDANLLFVNNLPNYDGGWYHVSADYTSESMTLDLTILDDVGATYFQQSVQLSSPLANDSQFGISSWSSNASNFDNFSLELTEGSPSDVLMLLGDFSGDGRLSSTDADLLVAAYGTSGPSTAALNLATPDSAIDQADLYEWLQVIVPTVHGIGPASGDYNLDGKVDQDDYVVWTSGFGATDGYLAADGNFDGVVDAADYTIWRDHLGAVGSQAAANGSLAVPEPFASFLWFGVGIVPWLRRGSILQGKRTLCT